MITPYLHRYLQQSRDALVASLDGLSEYDVRRPMTPTATNLLGLVKHLAGIEFGYLGECVGRPVPVPLPWNDETIWDSADMWALPGESREYLVGLYRRAWRHTDESLEQLGLDAPATVAWWPEERRETTLGHLLVRVVAETAQHAGHADIVRELVDGRAGRDHEDIGDTGWWDRHVARVREAAEHHR
ncbi:DinB family protein [Actinophytocola glycyrrhizae]|uniref:DinB family protein n=1 Tax=Actinophytocola glycyrrhizae TaxID=2044873 RepID=A0ABV9S445_9PSEU